MATTDTRNVDWPATDFEARPAAGGPGAQAPAAIPARRQSRLAADLATAIRRTSEAARDAQLAVVADEAKDISQKIQEQLVEGAAGLRVRSEDAIADIREWAKIEAARVKAEMDARIAARKDLLEEQLADHAAATRDRSASVEAAVSAYRETMDAFFRNFLTEEDPARLATIAETMPEPPSLWPFLDADASWADLANVPSRTPDAAGLQAADAASHETEPAWSADEAEAEAALLAASFEMGEPDEVPSAPAPATAKAGKTSATKSGDAAEGVQAATTQAPADTAAELKSTQIIVTGLVSVASVASFRRALGRLQGVSAVTVTSGADREFLFHASHRRDVAFETAIPALPGFVCEITGAADGAISVTTLDPETER